ncbi:MAG: hypothetical protein CVV55_05905 [Synergistetes bacterium HGW-Synergistetes-2]|nr:MAG: hypothetical protein CVV55_05905 [Synergistetes bacterium HGW-Synergistetes-2]
MKLANTFYYVIKRTIIRTQAYVFCSLEKKATTKQPAHKRNRSHFADASAPMPELFSSRQVLISLEIERCFSLTKALLCEMIRQMIDYR